RGGRRGADRAGLSGVARRDPRRAHVDVLARRVRPAPAGAHRGGRRMNRRAIEIDGGTVLAYGHYGRPVIAFPSEEGEAHDWADRGMVDALGGLPDAGKLKLYCVPSFDRESWTSRDLSLEALAPRHGQYQRWIL